MAQTPYIIQTPQNSPSALNKLISAGLGIGITVGGFFVVRKLYRDWQARQASDAAGGDVNIQNAIKIKEAIQGIGTDNQALFNVASQIIDWKATSIAYRKLYNSNLIDDVRKDLKGTELAKFLNLYNAAINKTADGNFVSPKQGVDSKGVQNIRGYLVVTEKPAIIRKSPVFYTRTDRFISYAIKAVPTNFITEVPAGKYIGLATGKILQDEKSPESTLYIEVVAFFLSIKDNKPIVTTQNVYVASSQVRAHKRDPKKTVKEYNILTFKQSDYEYALNGFGENSNYQSKLILTANSAAILDVEGNLVNMVTNNPKVNLILGHKDSQYSKNNKDYFVFATIQGQKRMIETNLVKEEKI